MRDLHSFSWIGCWGGGRGRPIITREIFPCIFISLGWGRGRSQNHRKYNAFYALSLFIWLDEGASGQRIIENTLISIHVHCLFDGYRIIENILISIHFDGLFGGVGCAGSPRIIKETLMSMQCDGLFGGVGGVGDRRIVENACVSMHGHALFGGVSGPIII